jgi:hypothetical protein
MCAKFDQNERIVPIASGRSKSSRNVRSSERQERHEVGGHADRARARTAAAVRDRKRLVQVEVHEVEAHVARPAVAHQRVGVRAVVVHQSAGRVHRRRDLVDVIFEQSERVRIGHHADGRIVADRRQDRVERDAATLVGLQRHDLVADHRRRGGIGAVRRIGHDDRRALGVAALREIRFRDQQRGQLGVRAGRRVERERGHAEERGQAALELPHYGQRALRERVGRVGMQIAHRRKVGQRVVDARVVLHRARAERIERRVDAERLLREPREVAHDVEFAVVG